MTKQILMAHGQKRALMQAMHSTYPTIRAALRYECDTEISKKIRYVAVKEFGGVETKR